MVEAWCVKCRKKVNVKDGVKTKTKKGVPMLKGECPSCKTKVCRIGGF